MGKREGIKEFLSMKIIRFYISLVFLFRRLQNTKYIWSIIIILFLLPWFFAYHIYENPETPEGPDVSSYSQEYYRYEIFESEDKIVAGKNIFYFEHQKIQDVFTFNFDLSEISILQYEVKEAKVKIRDEERVIDPIVKYEKEQLSIMLIVSGLDANSGDVLKVECPVILKREKLLEKGFTLPLEIPRTTQEQLGGFRFGYIKLSLPESYHLTHKSALKGPEDKKPRCILLAEQVDHCNTYVIFLTELKREIGEEGPIIFNAHISPSEDEGPLFSGQDNYMYDCIEAQIEMLEKEFLIKIRTHLSNISDGPINAIMNPLIYFVYSPEDLKVLRYNLSNGNILQEREEDDASKGGKQALLERKDGLSILNPGEDIWIEIESTLFHNIDLKEKKIFIMPPIPVIALNDKFHISYELKMPHSATKIIRGYPSDYILKDRNILEWNYRYPEERKPYLFCASFVNNVVLPENNWTSSLIFIFIFFSVWVIFLIASYHWYQNTNGLFFSGLALLLSFFITLIGMISPLNLRFLQDPYERSVMSLLWSYELIFPVVSFFIYTLGKISERRR